MHRPHRAAPLAAFLVVAFAAALPAADTVDALRRARQSLDRKDARAAVNLLTTALPAASAPDRPEVLKLLRQAYSQAIAQAEAAGRTREVEAYREDLQILGPAASEPAAPRANAPKPEPAPAPRPEPVLPKPEPAPTLDPPAEPVAPPASIAPLPRTEPEPIAPPITSPTPATGPTDPPGSIVPAAAEPSPAASTAAVEPAAPAVDISEADAAFRSKKYSEAGRLYAALAADDRLPAERREAWAYCRCYDVVQKINARPTDPAQWEAIHAEIDAIRQLSPKNWFGEYLRNLAADRAPAARAAGSRPVVVRGTQPEEPRRPRPQAQPRPAPAPVAVPAESAPAPAPAAKPADSTVGRSGGTWENWQVWETTNFRILHADEALARRVAAAAEATRDEQVRRWTGATPRGPWSPRCDIYLYPTAAVYHERTGQPADSPGFSTMGQGGGRIVARRINLRADHADLVGAVLPHEITHVILADFFPDRPPPKWADEGMAVLSEPGPLQDKREVPLARPIADGRLFRLADLMNLPDYPDPQYWDLFFAQSVSLTRFLVARGSPAQFLRFVQDCQRSGVEPALQRAYQIDGLASLERDWREHARASIAAATKPDGVERATQPPPALAVAPEDTAETRRD